MVLMFSEDWELSVAELESQNKRFYKVITRFGHEFKSSGGDLHV